MEKNSLRPYSAYAGSCIILTTKHAKSLAISPPFQNKLKATILEYVLDTDKLGTFSGEIEREGTALECARRKCEWSLEQLGNKIEFALASEGSFGPHPFIPMTPCDSEILYFIDRRHDFHFHMTRLSEKTNYRMEALNSIENLYMFAEEVLFPSHGLILRPNSVKIKKPVFKGVDSNEALENAFSESLKHSLDGYVWVETDMRAHFNPSRMLVIQELAEKLVERLSTHCPRCDVPGWGKVRVVAGLPCSSCGCETKMIKHEIFGCTKCIYEEIHEREDHLKKANPANCHYCNP